MPFETIVAAGEAVETLLSRGPSEKMLDSALSASKKLIAEAQSMSGVPQPRATVGLEPTSQHDGRISDAIFQQAFALSPSETVSKQLDHLRAERISLANVHLKNIRPQAEGFLGSSPTELVAPDGQSLKGYSRILPSNELVGRHDLGTKDVPTQFISANLFGTVPASALHRTSIRGEMFADNRLLSRTAAQYEERLQMGAVGQQLYDAQKSVWSGHPQDVLVTRDVGLGLSGRLSDGTYKDHVQWVLSDGKIETEMQKVFLDREILGDKDGHSMNITWDHDESSPTKVKWYNIDLERAFGDDPKPGMVLAFWDVRIAGRKLAPDLVAQVGGFLDTYSTVAGRSLLQGLGLPQNKYETVMSRAAWFVDHKAIPSFPLR